MAIKQPVYERSAVEVISPMLSINQSLENRNKTNWDRLSTGVKGLSEGLSGAYAMKKRSDEIEYKGDQYLADLERQLAEAQAELTQVENSMRTIKAEDSNSLDKEWPEPTLHNAEQDVDTWGIDNEGRLSSLNKDTYDFMEEPIAPVNTVGRDFNNKLLSEEENYRDPYSRYLGMTDQQKKYKMGGF